MANNGQRFLRKVLLRSCKDRTTQPTRFMELTRWGTTEDEVGGWWMKKNGRTQRLRWDHRQVVYWILSLITYLDLSVNQEWHSKWTFDPRIIQLGFHSVCFCRPQYHISSCITRDSQKQLILYLKMFYFKTSVMSILLCITHLCPALTLLPILTWHSDCWKQRV